jgi:hypothetical protein
MQNNCISLLDSQIILESYQCKGEFGSYCLRIEVTFLVQAGYFDTWRVTFCILNGQYIFTVTLMEN